MLDVATLRAQFSVLQSAVYLNAGGIGPTPQPVSDTLVGLIQQISAEGPDGMAFSREPFTQAKATRAKVARLLNGDADEISLVRSTAEGFNIVGHGLSWRAGDEVIYGAGDHPAARAIWTILAQRHGIRLIPLELRDAGPDAIVSDLAALITPRTRLISLSHVTSENGLRVPARAIADLAHHHGAYLMLDGCQAVGQFPVDVRALGCDFYAAGAYKWLLGPFGTGFLWTRRDLLPTLLPSWVGAGGTTRFDPETATWEALPSGEKFEFGARYWPVTRAMGAAIDFVTDVGLEAIAARERLLVDRMRERLAEREGIIDFSPRCAELRTGMVGAAVTGMDGKDLAERLREQNIHVRGNRGPGAVTGVRLCLAFFVTEDDVDYTADALAKIAAGG